jgi:transposase-like protein
MAMERMKDCRSVSALADELGVHRTILYQWQRQMEHSGESSGRATSPVRELCKQVRELKRVLAEKTLEADFFKGALQKVEARRQSSRTSGGTASTTRSGR